MNIIDFFKKHEYKFVLIIGLILVAILSFEAGTINGQKIKQNPLIIKKPVENTTRDNLDGNMSSEAQKLTSEAKKENIKVELPGNCVFVGSKNSNKYHAINCRYAKSIKKENMTCFSSENDAKSKGYLPDKNCIK